MPDLATLSIDGAVARLTLNRPEQRNALSLDLLDALHARVDELGAAKDATVCVITGEGRSFCAGMDLKAVLNEPGAPARLLTSIAELTMKIRALPMATIARINGAAIGGGCGIACVCDLGVTTPEAKLGYPEVDLGVCPAVVAPWLISKIGAGAARRVLLMGGTMSGREAHALGLVTHLAEDGDLDTATGALVERLASAGPEALRATKAWMNRLDALPSRDVVLEGAAISARVVTGDEARERLEAAFARRG